MNVEEVAKKFVDGLRYIYRLRQVEIAYATNGVVVRIGLPQTLMIYPFLLAAIVKDAESYASQYGIGVEDWCDAYYIYVKFISL